MGLVPEINLMILIIKFLSLERMYDQVVESCDCVDEETECSDARVQGEERIQQVLSVDGNVSEQLQSASSQILAKVVECLTR